jgi:hypothetical protein
MDRLIVVKDDLGEDNLRVITTAYPLDLVLKLVEARGHKLQYEVTSDKAIARVEEMELEHETLPQYLHMVADEDPIWRLLPNPLIEDILHFFAGLNPMEAVEENAFWALAARYERRKKATRTTVRKAKARRTAAKQKRGRKGASQRRKVAAQR